MSAAYREDTRPLSPAGVPGETGLWVFLLCDMAAFAAFFVMATVVRAQQTEMYSTSAEHLHRGLGAINTLVLLTASLLVVTAVRLTRTGDRRRAGHMVGAAIVAALVFLGVKVTEWALLASDHLGPSRNDFFELYYMLTGIHVLHVLGGVVALAIVRRNLANTQIIEGGASYWHMVDLLWLVLFAIFYLL